MSDIENKEYSHWTKEAFNKLNDCFYKYTS